MRGFSYSVPLLCLALAACRESPSRPELPPGPPQIPDRATIQIRKPANAPSEVLHFYREAYADLSVCSDLLETVKGQDPQGKHPDWSWRADFNPWQLIVKARVFEEDSVWWEIRLDGSGLEQWLQSGGITNRSSTYGSWEIYEFARSNAVAKVTWIRDEGDSLRIRTQLFEGETVDRSADHLELTGSPDGSGNLVVERGGVKIFEAQWDSSGAGSWTSWDAVTGNQTGSGTWPA